jgi:hypothetical protein
MTIISEYGFKIKKGILRRIPFLTFFKPYIIDGVQ